MQGFKVLSSPSHFGGFVAASGRGLGSLLAVCAALVLPAAGKAQATLSGLEDTTNVQQDVFYRGTDNNIYLRYYSAATGFQNQNVTTLAGAPAAGQSTAVSSFVDTTQNQQHVVFEGADGHIYQAYSNSNPTSWAYQDVTAITSTAGALPTSPLVSFADSTNDTQYIFYIGVNGDVNVLYWRGSWGSEDAGSVAGAVAAAAGSTLTGFQEPSTEVTHVFYEGTDQHIHELYAGPNSLSVGMTDVTAAAGSPNAAAGSSLAGYYDNTMQQENVFYVDTNANIQHVYFNYGMPMWQMEDLTTLGGGPGVAPGSALSAFQDVMGNQQHVFFVGSDGHLRQYYYAGAWYPNDLTASASGSVLPATNTPLTSFKDDPDNQQHVFYLGTDNHFYHYFYSAGWFDQDLTSGGTVPAI